MQRTAKLPNGRAGNLQDLRRAKCACIRKRGTAECDSKICSIFEKNLNTYHSRRHGLRANEKYLLALEAAHPRFAAWRAARSRSGSTAPTRELSKQTGRNEAVGHWISGYTDDIITLGGDGHLHVEPARAGLQLGPAERRSTREGAGKI